MKLKFNFNKRNRYKNICSIEGCNNSACGKYCNKHYHQIKRYGNIKTRTRFDKNEIIINDNIAKILLYNNNCNVIDYTIIDAEDINKISKYKISKCGNYAYANINNKQVALHRIITNTINELDKIHNPIDHINGNCLDNRKSNLRICTISDNMYNTYRQRNNSTGVRKHIQKGWMPKPTQIIDCVEVEISPDNWIMAVDINNIDLIKLDIIYNIQWEECSCLKGIRLEDVTEELEDKAYEEMRHN